MIRFTAHASRGRYNYLSPRAKRTISSQGVKSAEPEAKTEPADDWATRLLDKHGIKGPTVFPPKKEKPNG